MQRLSNSWNLFKLSASVLRRDKSLTAFPVLGAIASVVVFAVFGGIFWATGISETTDSAGSTSTAIEPIGWVIGAIFYIVAAFVTVYFQAALTAAADKSLRNEDTTVGDGIAAANERIPQIFAWSVVLAVVSMIIRIIEERFGFLGRIIAGLFGAAWNIVTFLAVPIIVIEHAGPGTALKRSGTLLRQTWGENLLGQFGIGLIGFLLFLPAAAVAGAGFAIGGPAAVALVVVAIVWILCVALVMSALTGIYRVALYRYAVDQVPPPAFEGFDFEHAFRQRRGSTGI